MYIITFQIIFQVTCGPNMKILDIVVRHPGSMHDNVIFERSSLRIRYENNVIQGNMSISVLIFVIFTNKFNF